MTGRYTDQHPQFSDSNGVPLAGGQIEFFTVGNTGVGIGRILSLIQL